MTATVFVLNGPNLNLLGRREPHLYGTTTLAEIEARTRALSAELGLACEFRQTNHEGVLVDWIQEAGAKKAAGIVINGAGFTTTSIAIHDALKAVRVPAIEVHVTNIFAREPWRHASVIAPVAKATMAGFGIHGYALAIEALAGMTGKKTKR